MHIFRKQTAQNYRYVYERLQNVNPLDGEHNCSPLFPTFYKDDQIQNLKKTKTKQNNFMINLTKRDLIPFN